MFSEKFHESLLNDDEPFPDILGLEETKTQLKSALLADRHLIIVGPPGIGKTTLAKNVAKLLPDLEVIQGCPYHCTPKAPICPQCRNGNNKKAAKDKNATKSKGEDRFIRIQGSPDLAAEDLLGDIDPIKALQYGPSSLEAFTPGKIFKANNGILFFDELNRCPEKLQNALLQVLEEGKATLGAYDIDIPADFLFIGTMNPEDNSTEPMSDVLLDRFDLVFMPYPDSKAREIEIVKVKGKKFSVLFPNELLDAMVEFVRLLRESDQLEKKPSVRASLGLYERSQTNAVLRKAAEVSLEDLSEAVVSVLSHRIRLKPSVKYLQSPKVYVKDQFKKFIEQIEDKLQHGDLR